MRGVGLWAAWLGVSACAVGEVSDNPLATQPLALQLTEAAMPLADGAGFADQRGGGVFVDEAGRAVRLRLDGTQAALASHPANAAAPTRVRRVLPIAADSAWVIADNGVYVASAGWLYELRLGKEIAPDDVVATAVASDEQAFVALRDGLYRLDAGELSQLTADGAAVRGVTALAVAPAPDGSSAVWFLQGARLRYAKQLSRTRYEIADAGLPASMLEPAPLGLVGVSAAPGVMGQLWLLTSKALVSHSPERGFQIFQLPGGADVQGQALLSAGRYAWLQAGGVLYRYAADLGRWGELSGQRDVQQLLAADEAGSVWVRAAGGGALLSDRAMPRVLGLFEGARVYAPDVLLSARLLASDDPLGVTFVLDDGESIERTLEQASSPAAEVSSLDFSLGGFDASGREQSYSFAGLAAGLHTLSVRAAREDGETERRLHFDMRNEGTLQLSWAKDVAPIYAARCEKCHAAGAGHPGHLLDSYELWNKERTQIVAAVVAARMPADGPLDPSQIQTVQRWAAAGGAP